MLHSKEQIIEILSELEWTWELASGFKKLIILTSNSELIDLLQEIIYTSLQESKLQIENEHKLQIQKKLKEIKSEERNKTEMTEDFLENNLHTIL